MHSAQGRMLVALIVVCCTTVGSLGAVGANGTQVVVNGQPLLLEPGPREQAGRVFVPLRAIFERLGASVVYQSGTINATKGATTISLRIGSTQAAIDGRANVLDVAPFIAGDVTFVPLRFVATALGAFVDYDAAARVVAIDLAEAPPPEAIAPVRPERPIHPPLPPVRPVRPIHPPRPTQPPQSALYLVRQNPAAGARITEMQPRISTDFSQRAEPNTVRVMLDGADVSGRASRSATGIVYAPPSPLQRNGHTVRVSGSDARGARFDRSWSFSIAGVVPTPQPPARNSVSLTAPDQNAQVNRTFPVRGKTLARSRVRIVAAPQLARGVVGATIVPPGSSVTYNVVADANGNFAQSVTLSPNSTLVVQVVVTSTAPNGQQAEAQRQVRVRK
jgi:hypothetical protein